MYPSDEAQLAALDLFAAAVSTSSTTPASFLERALQCGLSDYLIEATRSGTKGTPLLLAEASCCSVT